MTEDTLQPADYRIILLGASNLTLSLPRLITSLRAGLPGKVEILAAAGHGRSYLGWSHVIHRGLPGLQDCSLWETIKQRPPAKQTYAMFTDLGCDLFYGAMPQQIVDAVQVCMTRFQEMSAKTIYVRPPLGPLNKISNWRYYLVKNVFFPSPTIPWATMQRYIHEVEAGASQIATELDFETVIPKDDWYGFDPIHIKRSFRDIAWSEILSPWDLDPTPPVSSSSLREALNIWTRKAAEGTLWRVIKRQRSQPVIKWEDGSTLSLF